MQRFEIPLATPAEAVPPADIGQIPDVYDIPPAGQAFVAAELTADHEIRNGVFRQAAESIRSGAASIKDRATAIYDALPESVQHVVRDAGRGALEGMRDQYVDTSGNVRLDQFADALASPRTALRRTANQAVQGAKRGAVQGTFGR